MPDTDTVSHARKFLQGEQLKFAKANELWKRLKEEDQFSLARQVLRQLRRKTSLPRRWRAKRHRRQGKSFAVRKR
jgi:hypothetical protein